MDFDLYDLNTKTLKIYRCECEYQLLCPYNSGFNFNKCNKQPCLYIHLNCPLDGSCNNYNCAFSHQLQSEVILKSTPILLYSLCSFCRYNRDNIQSIHYLKNIRKKYANEIVDELEKKYPIVKFNTIYNETKKKSSLSLDLLFDEKDEKDKTKLCYKCGINVGDCGKFSKNSNNYCFNCFLNY